jgi:hypothetical protein
MIVLCDCWGAHALEVSALDGVQRQFLANSCGLFFPIDESIGWGCGANSLN